jgi:hypothetical protein
MGVVLVEFAGDVDTAVFADFARRMGGKVDFRFGDVGFDCVGFVVEKLQAATDERGEKGEGGSVGGGKGKANKGGFFKKIFKKGRKR